MKNTYWNNQGKHLALRARLARLIPPMGEVDPPALEKFRKASNCYYDYYNNGLGNRANEFYAVFGFSGRGASKERIEARMDDIIILAAFEQGMLVGAPEVTE